LKRCQECSETDLVCGVIEGGVVSGWEGLSLLAVEGESLLSCVEVAEEYVSQVTRSASQSIFLSMRSSRCRTRATLGPTVGGMDMTVLLVTRCAAVSTCHSTGSSESKGESSMS